MIHGQKSFATWRMSGVSMAVRASVGSVPLPAGWTGMVILAARILNFTVLGTCFSFLVSWFCSFLLGSAKQNKVFRHAKSRDVKN